MPRAKGNTWEGPCTVHAALGCFQLIRWKVKE